MGSNGLCYRLIDSPISHTDATAQCCADSATVALSKNAADTAAMLSVAGNQSLLIGADAIAIDQK